jgi:hypothetical protein
MRGSGRRQWEEEGKRKPVVVNENGKTEGETDVDYAEEEVEEDSDGDDEEELDEEYLPP